LVESSAGEWKRCGKILCSKCHLCFKIDIFYVPDAIYVFKINIFYVPDAIYALK
jgi:hypothetical protein